MNSSYTFPRNNRFPNRVITEIILSTKSMGFPGGSVVKNLPAKQETLVGSLDWEDPLEKEMATHSSILAWEIPWAKEPVRLVQGVTKSDTTE